MKTHTVQQGDTLIRIAYANGFDWEVLWNHPSNDALRQKRASPNVLLAGDEIHIPDKTIASSHCATGQRHTFHLKGIPARIRLRLDDGTTPMAGRKYTATIDGVANHGVLGGDGALELSVPADAVGGTLVVGEGESAVTYALHLGHLDPIDTITGLQARLNNLGFGAGPIDGALNADTQSALARFQQHASLPADGKPTADTLAKLREAHGS